MSTIYNGQYNEGALAGRYALKDLSNSGKFSNILNVIPYRVKTEILGSNITVLRGSSMTILYGLSEADLSNYNIYFKLTNDLTIDTGSTINASDQPAEKPEDFKYLVYNYEAGRLEIAGLDELTYHPEAIPAENIEANTFLNIYKQKCSLPIGYFDEYNTWHQFNSAGFFGRLAWVDAGLEGLCPNRRDDKGGLKILKTEINTVKFTEFSDSDLNNYKDGIMMMSSDGTLYPATTLISSTSKTNITEGYNYVTEDNIIYDSLGYEFIGCKLCSQSMKNGLLYNMSSFNTYAPANFGEISDRITAVDNSALHLTGKETVTEDAYGVKHFHDNVILDNVTINGGNLQNIDITAPLAVQCPEITSDVTKLTSLSASSAYNGQYGGLFIKYDAYITSAGSPTTNPNLKNHLQIVGASEAGKAGISLGNKQTVRVYGDSSESNLYVTLGTEGSILPDKSANNKYSIGSANYKFKEMHATNFIGTASSAYWADLAEKYITDESYPIGTIVKWGGKEELTIANNECDLAGVISEQPGFLMNDGQQGQPLALAGRVKVRVIGKVKKHDRIILSDVEGVGISINCFDDVTLKGTVIGRALENKDTDDEGLVLCAVQFHI